MTKKSLLKLAVASAVLSVSSANAANLSDSVSDAISYASELVAANTVIDDDNLDSNVQAGFGVAANTSRYIRFDLTNAKWANAVVASDANVSGVANETIAVATGGTTSDSYVIFQLSAGASSVASSDVITFALGSGTVDGVKVTDSGSSVSLAYSMYETAGDAVNGTSTGRLANKSETIASFAKGLSVSVTSSENTAIVSQAFKKFTSSDVEVELGKLSYGVSATAKKTDGSAVALADLVTAASKLVITGDFTAVDTAATGDGFYLANAATCGTSVADGTLNSAKTSAEITVGTTAVTDDAICYAVTGSTAIPVQTVKVTVDVTAAASTTTADVAEQTLGTIVRDGTTLVAPLVQIPDGWISRLVLANRGTTDAPYTVTATSETGVTLTAAGSLASGTIAAGKTVVITLDSTTLTGGGARGTLAAVIAAPSSSIDGLYQIVNGTTGSISNHTLISK